MRGHALKLRLWLLDLNDEVVAGRSEVRLWGIDGDGRRVLVVDRSIQPYFYLLLEAEADVPSVMTAVSAQASSLALGAVARDPDKRFFGRPVNALKITCPTTDACVTAARVLTKLHGVQQCLEADLRLSAKYLVDHEANPCGWWELDVAPMAREVDVGVDEVYLATSPPIPIADMEPPHLRILAFSTLCCGAKGTPRPARDPIAILSLATNRGDVKQWVADASDAALIEGFVAYIQAFDPDILSGYGVNTSEWPYLLARARRHGITLQVGRGGGEPHTSVYGHISVTGRANVDFYEFADEVPDVKVKTLENLARYLGALKEETGFPLDDTEIAALWADRTKRPRLLADSLHTVQTVLTVTETLLDFAIQLSNLIGLPLDHVGTAATGFRTEFYLMKQAHRLHELIPPRTPRPYLPYAGATVLQPKPGLHDDVVVLDFKSMYPNIMLSKNVSPDTYLPPGEASPPSGVYVAPEVGHRFRKQPTGFYSAVLTALLAAREELTRRLASLPEDDPVRRVLAARQQVVKVLTNAVYGYAGWVGARWYARPVAEATTAWGRATITRTIALARAVGLDVIYGDTDSLFVTHDQAKIDRLLGRVEAELGLEIRPAKRYTAVLFTEAKKRYAGLLSDGQLDVVGLEVARGDWTDAAKHVQEAVLTIVLTERSPAKAIAFTRHYLQTLRAHQVPYRDLVIWKTLTKPLARYKVRAPHVEAARLLLAQGWELTVDDKVGYVITKGAGRLYERAMPYQFSSYDALDLDYYETKQILPAAHRVLTIFDVSLDDLRPPTAVDPSRT
jgi:DNA polymerase I